MKLRTRSRRWLQRLADRIDPQDAETDALLRQMTIQHTDGTVQVHDGACLGCGARLVLLQRDAFDDARMGQVALTHKPGCPHHATHPLWFPQLYDARVEDQEPS